MEKINYDQDVYDITSIKEIREELGTVVSAIDTWFPHVGKNLVIRWGTKHFPEYYDTLIHTTRPNRRGFPEEVLKEIDMIGALHNKLFPQYETLKGEIVYGN